MSSRRSRRTQSGQPKYSGDDYDLDADLEQYNDVPPRRATRSKSDREDNIETESRGIGNYANDDIDDGEEITRCVCGNDDLIIPKSSHGEFDNIDTGFFIQCEKCAVWQHGYCVGIPDEDHAPEKYWCEQCKPEFHTLFIDKFNTRRSKYDPHLNSGISKKGIKRKNGRLNGRNSDSHQDQVGSLSGHNESFEGEDENKKKQRKRYYTTYEEQLKKALEESAKESGVAPEEVNVSSAEALEGPELRNSSLRKTRNRSGVSDNNESNADDDNDGEDERQDIKDEAEFNKNATQEQKVKLEDKHKIRDLKKMKIKNPNAQLNSNRNTDSANDENTTNKKNGLKKPKKDSKSQVIEDKPFKANLPSARISMNEMNRRVFSIIDFVSNTESNLSNEEEFKSNLFKMNDAEMSSEALELKAKLISCYNESVAQLDDLTQLLNVWQSEFA
ncbi:hypothetical protein CANINC_005065 [Pichia inconspicua]|uniref:Zinc finger PHD-type domain-containing protein n=1 Tax=Pichia inconspicua TaxID=52247 RepID=A0A4T0WVN4_9ASCO|nr:hypothetical protein CANINC_005065 [[Candida] inconspicua]